MSEVDQTAPAEAEREPVDDPRALSAGSARFRAASLGVVVLILAAIGVALAALLGAFDATAPSSPVDSSEPGAVAATFLQLDAIHDPGVCDLALTRLRDQLDLAGRCTGAAAGPAPTVIAQYAPVICGDRAAAGLYIAPAGALPAPYALVVLQRTGQHWSVFSVLFVSDPSILRPSPCEAPSGDGG